MLLFDAPHLLNSLGIECSITGSSWDLAVGRLDGPRWDTPRKVLGVCGGAMFLRSAALRKAGLLPDFQIYLDDLDLCLRIWNAGFEIWNCPEAVIRHKFSATMGAGKRLRQKYYLNTRNRMRLLLRNFPLSKLFLAKPKLLLGEAKSVGRGILDGDYWKLWAHAKAWGASLAYYPEAWRARRRHGTSARFWPQIRQDVLFFPGVELPENGWYAERVVNGDSLRPISQTAWMQLRKRSVARHPCQLLSCAWVMRKSKSLRAARFLRCWSRKSARNRAWPVLREGSNSAPATFSMRKTRENCAISAAGCGWSASDGIRLTRRATEPGTGKAHGRV
ncbi:MAG: glycosyltransferase family 2 protein [Candidatus Hydrogenedentales bacterium]